MEGQLDRNHDANTYTYSGDAYSYPGDTYTYSRDAYTYAHGYPNSYGYSLTHRCTYPDAHPNLKPDARGAGPQSLDPDAGSDR